MIGHTRTLRINPLQNVVKRKKKSVALFSPDRSRGNAGMFLSGQLQRHLSLAGMCGAMLECADKPGYLLAQLVERFSLEWCQGFTAK